MPRSKKLGDKTSTASQKRWSCEKLYVDHLEWRFVRMQWIKNHATTCGIQNCLFKKQLERQLLRETERERPRKKIDQE